MNLAGLVEELQALAATHCGVCTVWDEERILGLVFLGGRSRLVEISEGSLGVNFRTPAEGTLKAHSRGTHGGIYKYFCLGELPSRNAWKKRLVEVATR